ncbi:MAG: serine hydrolase [Lachnospiraceae bacterium]
MSDKMEQLLKNGTPTLREEVRQMAEVPVYIEPGTHWLYGFGSEIIGAVVEEITGKPLRVSFSERLIEPLGLKDTGTCLTPKIRKHLVTMYRKEHGTRMRWERAMPPSRTQYRQAQEYSC